MEYTQQAGQSIISSCDNQWNFTVCSAAWVMIPELSRRYVRRADPTFQQQQQLRLPAVLPLPACATAPEPLPPVSAFLCTQHVIHNFTHSFIHTVTHSFTHSFIHTITHLFIHSHIRSFIHSCIYMYIHASRRSCMSKSISIQGGLNLVTLFVH